MFRMSYQSYSTETNRRHLSLIDRQTFFTQEICRLSSDILPLEEYRVLKAHFDQWVRSFAAAYPSPANDLDKIKALVAFFFEDQGFRPLEVKSIDLKSSLIAEAIDRKKAPWELLTLLFMTLAESIQLKVKCIDDSEKWLLKVYIDDDPQIVNLEKSGSFLAPFEIVEFVNNGVDFTQWNLGERVFIRYLYRIRHLAKLDFNLHGLSVTQAYLMRYQPFNLKHLSERAKIAYHTGDYRGAAEDIRDYFIYKSPEITNFQLKKIYKMALKMQKKAESPT